MIVLGNFFPALDHMIQRHTFLIHDIRSNKGLRQRKDLLKDLIIFLHQTAFFVFILDGSGHVTDQGHLASKKMPVRFGIHQGT